MPSYDYRCNQCKRRVLLTYKTYEDYDSATPTCPHCKSTNLTRLISRVAIAKSESNRFSSLDDDSALNDLENADPATLGRYMRQMGEEAGEDLGDEFHDVVNRLERGESFDSIEQRLSESDFGGGDVPGPGMDAASDLDMSAGID